MKACKLSFADMNPLRRHNVLIGHQVGTKLKHLGTDTEVNTTQKNPNIASALGRILCPPGGHALVIGAGSGSEVVGLARAGVNVVGIERDPLQFQALTERVTAEAAYPEQAMKLLAEDDHSVRVLGALLSRFTNLIPDVEAHFAQFTEELRQEEQFAQPDEAVSSRAAPVKQACPACGHEVSGLETGVCPKTGCASGSLHSKCMVACSKCAKSFCSDTCKDDHGCPKVDA